MPFGFKSTSSAVRALLALPAQVAGLRMDVQTILKTQVKIMTAVQDINAALDKVDAAINAAEVKIDADAATIKDDIAKLAALAAAPQGASDADLKPIVDRATALADGLTKHLDPVTDAVPPPVEAPAPTAPSAPSA